MKERCPRCRNKRELHKFLKTKQRICKGCFKKDPANFKPCSWCGELKYPVTHDDQDQPICSNCNSLGRTSVAKLQATKKKLQKRLKVIDIAIASVNRLNGM